jgi:hypothetical protein
MIALSDFATFNIDLFVILFCCEVGKSEPVVRGFSLFFVSPVLRRGRQTHSCSTKRRSEINLLLTVESSIHKQETRAFYSATAKQEDDHPQA